MCGIAGIFNLNGEPVSPVLLRKMADAIAHRGPDGEGFYTDSFIGFGHRRLAIIDLSPAGHQPMVTSCGEYVISYNGEVYNFQELRVELEALGYRFHSHTDTEVVLYAYQHWGLKALSKLNGMFAFALWDRVRQELILARDRYGIKPLYYTLQGNKLLFGSEVKAIQAHPDYALDIDLAGLIEYFTFQNFFTERTLYEGVSIVPAGSYLRVKLGARSPPPPVRYWDFCFQHAAKIKDEREYEEELYRLFVQAVNRQLVSDVEIGAYLSGGMDSGSITAVSAKQLPYLKTFTVGFDLHSASGMELSFDERERAEHMSYLFKTEHYEMVLKAGDMERVIPSLVHYLEEPRVGQSYPNFYAAQLASKFVKVVLSGSGGDELFGGYPWRYYRGMTANSFDDYIDKYFRFWNRLIPDPLLKQVFSPVWKQVKDVDTAEIFRSVFVNHPQSVETAEDYINLSLYFECKTFLHGLLLVEDKTSMAHGLEARVPFLDNDLVDFAMSLPACYKLKHFNRPEPFDENEVLKKMKGKRSADGKTLLRKTMARLAPKAITEGVKQGFSAPDASWFKGESIDYVQKQLLNTRNPLYQYLDEETVGTLITEHIQGLENRRLLIWSLLNCSEWIHQHLPQGPQQRYSESRVAVISGTQA